MPDSFTGKALKCPQSREPKIDNMPFDPPTLGSAQVHAEMDPAISTALFSVKSTSTSFRPKSRAVPAPREVIK
jgi:hypothetical protein